MTRSASVPREIAVPVSLFESLRGELASEAGTLQTVRAMHHAGYHSGLAAAALVDLEAGGRSFSLGQAAFWTRLTKYFAKRGWGTLRHSAPHPAIGMLTSADWAEARLDDVDPDASCSFSSGFLSGLLSQLAGGPVAVLEVGCRSRGDTSCDFAFGSETAIHELYGHLLDGRAFDASLMALQRR
jgi:hypothetical protein